MESDLHFLRITDKANIPVPLDPDTDYQVIAEISTYGSDSTSNQDGTYSYTHKARFIGEVQLVKGDKVILGKKKHGSHSQRFRKKVIDDGFEYDHYMDVALRPDVFEEISTIIEKYL